MSDTHPALRAWREWAPPETLGAAASAAVAHADALAAALEAEVKARRELCALADYVVHDSACPAKYGPAAPTCTCGLRAALERGLLLAGAAALSGAIGDAWWVGRR